MPIPVDVPLVDCVDGAEVRVICFVIHFVVIVFDTNLELNR